MRGQWRTLAAPVDDPWGPPDGSRLGRFLRDPAGALARVAHTVTSIVDHPAVLRTAVLVTAAVAIGSVVIALARARARRRAARAARMVEVLAPPEPDVAAAAAFWANLHELLGPRRRWLEPRPHLAFEYRWRGDGLRIVAWVPGNLPPGLLERAVEAAWPGAAAVGCEDDNAPLPAGWASRGGELRLTAPGWYPLRTDFDAEPLRPLLGTAVCGDGDAAAVQILARPLGRRAARRCQSAARRLRAGRPEGAAGRAFDIVGSAPAKRPNDPIVNADVRGILGKAEEQLWQATVRYGVATKNENHPIRRLRGRAHGVAAAFAIYAGRNSLQRHRVRSVAARMTARTITRPQLLSTAEVAALAHVPTDQVVPSMARAGSRAIAPPASISREHLVGRVIGVSDAGPERKLVLRTEDARYHVHIMGSTGSGKSTLLVNMILQDAEAGRGAVVIDPKGDLVADVLARLDPRVRARTVVLDPQSGERPPTLNMLEVPKGVTPDLVVDNLVGIFARIFEPHWGPRIEDILRSATLTLLRKPGATLSDIPKVLTLPGAYEQYLDTGPEDELRGFWAWYESQSLGMRSQVTGPLLYKLRSFLLRPYARAVVNSPRSSIRLPEILDGGLLLVRVPKGVLGEDTSRLLGSFVVARVWQAATARAAIPESQRLDASLIVDECQNFLSLPRSFDEISAEARGYRLSLVLAHQHLGQLPRELKDAISANARNKLLFTVSPEDAKALQRHVQPDLGEHDLSHLGKFQAAARFVVGGEEQPACTLRTVPLLPAPPPPAEPDGARAGEEAA